MVTHSTENIACNKSFMLNLFYEPLLSNAGFKTAIWAWKQPVIIKHHLKGNADKTSHRKWFKLTSV